LKTTLLLYGDGSADGRQDITVSLLFSTNLPDNGPWLVHNQSAGSEGLITGRASGYWNTGKGSTWDGATVLKPW
jgi:hypothetical protein